MSKYNLKTDKMMYPVCKRHKWSSKNEEANEAKTSKNQTNHRRLLYQQAKKPETNEKLIQQ